MKEKLDGSDSFITPNLQNTPGNGATSEIVNENIKNQYTINIDCDYKVSLKTNTESFTFKSLKKQGILLKGHYELPEDFSFMYPQLHDSGHILSAIGKGGKDKDYDLLYFWNTKYLECPPVLKMKAIDKIQTCIFTPDGTKFIVFYENNPPALFDFEKGSKILDFETTNTNKKVTQYSFSSTSENLAISSNIDFIVYKIQTGKVLLKILSNAPLKILINEQVTFIDENLMLKSLNLKNKKIINNFKLEGLASIDKVLCATMTENKDYIYFLDNNGLNIIDINNKKSNYIPGTEGTVEIVRGVISDDCKMFITTDMTSIYFWSISEDDKVNKIGFYLKEKFTTFSIDFIQAKILTSNDYCIDITDIKNENCVPKYIWLNKNPSKFDSYKFSPDYKVLFAKYDKYNAIAYDTITGNVIKKWQIKLPNFYLACDIVPMTSLIGVIVSKSYDNFLKVWDYMTGTDLSTFIFDTYHINFDKAGYHLACGTIKGEEIARVYNLSNEHQHNYFYKKSTNSNKNTLVQLFRSKSKKLMLLCVSELQNPVVFDYATGNIVLECVNPEIEFLSNLKSISINLCNSFFVLGKDNHENETAQLFNLETGELIKEYFGCKLIQFAEKDEYVLINSLDIDKDVICIQNIQQNKDKSVKDLKINGHYSSFLSDQLKVITLNENENEEDNNKKSIFITDVASRIIEAEIIYEKKSENYTEFYIDTKNENNDKYLIFRFIELRNPKPKSN